MADNDAGKTFSQTCTKTDPKSDNGNVWKLQRTNAQPIVPVYPPSIDCMKYESGYNYIKGDVVCDGTVNLWQCSETLTYTLACKTEAP